MLPRNEEHMANGTGHMIAGGVSGAVVLMHHRRKENKRVELGEMLVSIAVGIFFGLLADKLEPAVSPNHRAFFHSVVFFAFAAWQLYRLCCNEESNSNQQLAFKLIGTAYASHLLLDSITPKGLPLV